MQSTCLTVSSILQPPVFLPQDSASTGMVSNVSVLTARVRLISLSMTLLVCMCKETLVLSGNIMCTETYTLTLLVWCFSILPPILHTYDSKTSMQCMHFHLQDGIFSAGVFNLFKAKNPMVDREMKQGTPVTYCIKSSTAF